MIQHETRIKYNIFAYCERCKEEKVAQFGGNHTLQKKEELKIIKSIFKISPCPICKTMMKMMKLEKQK